MKTSIKHKLTLLLFAGTLFCAANARANFNFHLNINVASLIGNANGPFSLDFQLNDGSGTLAGVNTVTLSNFTFVGGTPTGSPTLLGTASGSLGSTVTLNDGTNQFNEFYQGFSGTTSSIGFDVSTTTNSDPLSPDQLIVAVLDSTIANIPTTAPDTSDALVKLGITSTVALADVTSNSYTSIAPDAGVTVAAVPEPSSVAMFSLGMLGMLSIFRRRRAQA